MSFWRLTLCSALLLLCASSLSARTVRVATFNVKQGVGTPGSAEYLAVSNVLARINADIIAFQELQSGNRTDWETLGASMGYSNRAFSGATSLSGNLYTGYFSRHPIPSSFNVYSPPGANEITRPPFRVVVNVPGTASPLVLWTLHHKALSGSNNEFRRAVESIRCAQNIGTYLAANPTHQEYIVLGDMNADVNQFQTSQFNALPSGLPTSYSLGSDITFPVHYAVFPQDAYEPAGSGMVMLAAFHEDSLSQNTFIGSGGRLDYLFVSSNLWTAPLGAPVTEVYNSAQDDGTGGLPKFGSPLPASTSSTASDHYLLFMDVQMRDAFTLHVSPGTGIVSSGPFGGPFAPTSWNYTLSNGTPAAVSWQVELPSWLSASPTSGILSAGSSLALPVSLSGPAAALPVGRYTTNLVVRDLSNHTTVSRTAQLDVLANARLVVNPAIPFGSSGPEGGPFFPQQQVYTVSNSGAFALGWMATSSVAWIELVPSSGTLSSLSSVTVTARVTAAANALGIGSQAGTLSFINPVNGDGSTNLAASLHVLDSNGLSEDAESGGPGWVANGLWHILNDGNPCARVRNGSHSWWYGSDSLCSYDVGTSSGTLTSPIFVVPPQARLSFWSWEQTEGEGTSWDQRRVEISLNDGASWTQVYQSSVSPSDWRFIVVDLSAHAGTTARIRFFFDTVDNVNNAYAGWYLDDIRVSPPGALAADPTLAQAAGEQFGPFAPNPIVVTVTNLNSGRAAWSLAQAPSWLSPVQTSGLLESAQSAAVPFQVNASAAGLQGGLYPGVIVFTNALDALDTAEVNVSLLVRDGIPDAWRFDYFGHVEPDAGDLSRAGDDADLDGSTNYEEYLADTNPRDDQSKPMIPSIAWEAGHIRVRFPSSAARVYTLEFNDQLTNDATWAEASDLVGLPGTGGEISYLDDGTGTGVPPSGTPCRTYRLIIGLP